jgi:hypothetical protein
VIIGRVMAASASRTAEHGSAAEHNVEMLVAGDLAGMTPQLVGAED